MSWQVPWAVRGGVVLVDSLDRRATILNTAPATLDHLERLMKGPRPYQLIPAGERVLAANDRGMPEEADVVIVARTQPANAGNEQTAFALKDSGAAVHDVGLIVAIASGAPLPRFQHGERLLFWNLANPEAYADRVVFDPRETEPAANEAPKRWDRDQLQSFLRFILEETLDPMPVEGVVRFEARDEGGASVGARAFHYWQYIEARRWVLDNMDSGVNTFWDGLIRRAPPLGHHKKTPAVGALLTAATDAPDLTLHTPTGDVPLTLHRDTLAPAPAKGEKPPQLPIPGLPIRDEDSETLVTWTRSS